MTSVEVIEKLDSLIEGIGRVGKLADSSAESASQDDSTRESFEKLKSDLWFARDQAIQIQRRLRKAADDSLGGGL